MELRSWYLSSTKALHCLQAINFKNVIIPQDTIYIFCPPKYSCILTNWCTRRNKVPRSDSPALLWSAKNLPINSLFRQNWFCKQKWIFVTAISHVYVTSSRYFSPFWEVRLTQAGPQPHLGPHSYTTSLASINLEGRINIRNTPNQKDKNKSDESTIWICSSPASITMHIREVAAIKLSTWASPGIHTTTYAIAACYIWRKLHSLGNLNGLAICKTWK